MSQQKYYNMDRIERFSIDIRTGRMAPRLHSVHRTSFHDNGLLQYTCVSKLRASPRLVLRGEIRASITWLTWHGNSAGGYFRSNIKTLLTWARVDSGRAGDENLTILLSVHILVKTREFVQRKAVTVGNGNWTVLGNDF